jgi:hypothetical protein
MTVAHATPRCNIDAYVNWLQSSNQIVYDAAGTFWRLYQHGLIPASLKPEPIKISNQQAKELLHKSGALFLRYFTRTLETQTPFWYTA